MGLFDKIFGRGASKTVAQASDQQKFAQLRQKYLPALQVADQNGIRMTKMELQSGPKFYVHGIAPSEQAKDAMWTRIKAIDPSYSDLSAEIVVNPQASPGAQGQSKTYTVQSGDTLSKISKQFYGDADEYMRIFYANRDKINDPDMINVGHVLTIPPDDDQ